MSLLAYDNVMNRQREAVYDERQTILNEGDMVDYGWGVVNGVIVEILDRYFPGEGEPDAERTAARMRTGAAWGAACRCSFSRPAAPGTRRWRA